MSELKTCPFCAGEASIKRMGTSRVSMQIECLDCGASLETGETWIDNNSHWNVRDSNRVISGLQSEIATLRKSAAEIGRDAIFKALESVDSKTGLSGQPLYIKSHLAKYAFNLTDNTGA